MACVGVKCAFNATCYSTSSVTHICKCDHGYTGDGVVQCEIEKIDGYTVPVALVVGLFCVLVGLLLFIRFKYRLDKTKGKPTADPYSINWYAYIKEWKSTTILRKEKVRKPIAENGFSKPNPAEDESTANKPAPALFKIDDVTVQEQKSKLQQPSPTNSIRIQITPDEDEDENAECEGEMGVDNPAYILQQRPKQDGTADSNPYEEIRLSSFKPLSETTALEKEGLQPVEKTMPNRPPPYSSKHSFKEVRRSPRIKPRITSNAKQPSTDEEDMM